MKNVNFYLENIPLIILGGMLFISACSGNNRRETEDTKSTTIHIDVNHTEAFDINEVAKVVKYVPLETHNNALIGTISKLYFKNDSVIVFDRENNNIFFFDQNGNFIRKIGEKGNGLSEYIEFNDIHYDFTSDKLYAFERFQNKMFVYTLNGNLEETINSNFAYEPLDSQKNTI